MKKLFSVILLAVAAAAIIFAATSCSEVPKMEYPTIYPYPDGLESCALYKVTVHTDLDPTEREVPCYAAEVGRVNVSGIRVLTETMAFCQLDFDFRSPLYFTVTPESASGEAVIRPLAKKLDGEFDGKSLTFTMTEPGYISVEFGDIYRNLFIFADKPEEKTYSDGDENVVYYGPGLHDADAINLKSGQTLYIAGGAVVYGYLSATDADNVTVAGRGILTGEKLNQDMDKDRLQLVKFTNCKNVNFSGITLLASPTWTFTTDACENVSITNMKEICWNFNSDGFDIVGSKNVTIDNIIQRNYDDNISLKAWNDRDCTGITMKNSVLWADKAHNMLVGPEAKEAETNNRFGDVLFENIDVLESNEGSDFYRGVMALTCSDNSVFDNIKWKDIRVERMTSARLINFRFSSDYGTTIGKEIKNITVENVDCLAEPGTQSVLIGENGASMHDITLKNITVSGKKWTASDNGFDPSQFGKANNVRFE